MLSSIGGTVPAASIARGATKAVRVRSGRKAFSVGKPFVGGSIWRVGKRQAGRSTSSKSTAPVARYPWAKLVIAGSMIAWHAESTRPSNALFTSIEVPF